MNKYTKKKAPAAGSDLPVTDEPTSTTGQAGGGGRDAPCVHDFRGTPIKGRRWCIKFGCGKFEPRAAKAKEVRT